MKFMLSMFVLCLALLVSSAHAVELRWQPAGIDKLKYRAAAEVNITGKLGDLKPEQWIKHPAEFRKIIHKLKALPVPATYLHYRMRLKAIRHGSALRARMIGVPVKFKGKPANEQESELRDSIYILTNAIMLQGDMDLSGDSAALTFYRMPRQRNILTLFFYLPKRNVHVGDNWTLPVKFLEFGPGFFAQHSAIHNQVTMTALRHTPQGTVAELHYLISERADGYVNRLAGGKRFQYGLSVTSFGYGEFLVEKGHWLRQENVISYQGRGKARLHKQELFALKLQH